MRFRMLACAAAACCLLAGCGKNDSDTQKSMTSDPEQLSTTEAGSEVSDPADSRYSLNFLYGTITLPCKVKDLDFIDIDEPSLFTSFGYTVGHISCDGWIIGTVFIDEADLDKELSEQTVVGLDISSFSAYGVANIKANYMGVAINDTREKLEEVLGEPDPEKSDDSCYYYLLDENDKEKYVEIDFDYFDRNKIESIALYVK